MPSSVRHDHHRVTDDLVADLVALLIHRCDRILRQVFILGHGYRIVDRGIKAVSRLAERLNLELFKTLFELLGDQLDALAEFFGHFLALELRERVGHAVGKRQQLLDRACGSVVVDLQLFRRGALAVVVVLRKQAQIFFFFRLELLCQLFLRSRLFRFLCGFFNRFFCTPKIH